MKKLLESKNIEILYNNNPKSYKPKLSDDIIFFPIRHHSPISSYQLGKLIDSYNPDLILIEGATNLNEIKDKFFLEGSKMPLAFYTVHRFEEEIEEDGSFTKEKRRDAVYYPFTSFSPEYIALKKGKEKEIDTRFIDLPYSYFKIYGGNYEATSNDSALQHSQYIAKLCENLNVTDFNDFWETHFETNRFKDSPEKFIETFYTFCYYSRKSYTLEALKSEGNIAREVYMISQIEEAKKEYKKIIVVTGGFHTPSLLSYDYKNKRQNSFNFKLKKYGEIKNYVVPYSYDKIDERSGYKSGIIFPLFHKGLLDNYLKYNLNDDFDPFYENILTFLHKFHKDFKEITGTSSIVNKIEALRIMDGLKSLRDKLGVTSKEMFDAIISSYSKSEIDEFNIVSSISRVLTGKNKGEFIYKDGDNPIILNFHKMVKKYRLKLSDGRERIELYPDKKQIQKEKSLFFHKLVFLNISFATLLVKNPSQLGSYNNNKNVYTSSDGKGNYLNDDNRYVSEVWDYIKTTETYVDLIESSLYGSTIDEAALNKFEEVWNDSNSFSYSINIFINMLKLELLPNRKYYLDSLETILDLEMQLTSLIKGFSTLYGFINLNNSIPEIYRFEYIFDKTYEKILKLLYFTDNLAREEENQFLNNLKIFFNILIYDIIKKEEFKELLISLRETLYDNFELLGGIDGMLSSLGVLTEEELIENFNKIVQGVNSSENSALYLKGIFTISRELFFTNQNFIEQLNNLFLTLEEDEFLEMLPQLREAFTFFSPNELSKIAKNVATSIDISEDELEKELELDISAEETMLIQKTSKKVYNFLTENKLVEF